MQASICWWEAGLKALKQSSQSFMIPIYRSPTIQRVKGRYCGWFIHISSPTASRSYQPLDPHLRKVESQVKAGLPPPWASLNLSRHLFKECDSIHNILLAKEPNPDAQKSAAHYEDFAVKPKDPPKQSMAAPRPTPILPSVEEEEVMNTSSDTPFLDDFVGERDKEDETKLMGAVKEALAHLVWVTTIDGS
jgi:hypothetical protein